MVEIIAFGGAQLLAPRQREGHGQAHHKHKGRLDHVPENATLPRYVIKPARNAAPRWIAVQCGKTKTFGSEDEHDETAVGIERGVALRFRPAFRRDAFHRRWGRKGLLGCGCQLASLGNLRAVRELVACELGFKPAHFDLNVESVSLFEAAATQGTGPHASNTPDQPLLGRLGVANEK